MLGEEGGGGLCFIFGVQGRVVVSVQRDGAVVLPTGRCWESNLWFLVYTKMRMTYCRNRNN